MAWYFLCQKQSFLRILDEFEGQHKRKLCTKKVFLLIRKPQKWACAELLKGSERVGLGEGKPKF
jgi:hypothetical protein